MENCKANINDCIVKEINFDDGGFAKVVITENTMPRILMI